MPRTIIIKITVDNRQAINDIKSQREEQRQLREETRFLNEEQRKNEIQAVRLTKANKDLDTAQKSLVASIAEGYLIGKAVSAVYTTIAGSIGFAATQAAQFEFQMNKISVITGTGRATMMGLEKTIRDLAVATNQSQNEIAKAALEMGKMGFSGTQLEQALDGVVRLSRALDEDISKTGETVVQVLNAYGFSAADAGKITDQLAYTVKASALDIESFGTAFAYVGGTAKAAGVSFTELQGAMDVLSNAGIKASTIGTSLRRIIADLSDPSSKASQAIGGQTIETLGLVGALEALKAKHIDIAGLTEIFGRTASSTSSILIRYAGVVKLMADETEKAKGVNNAMSEGMNTTLISSLQGVKTAWTDLGIEISKSTGFLSTFARVAAEALHNVSDNMKLGSNIERFKAEQPDKYKEIINRGGIMDLRGPSAKLPESTEFQTAVAKWNQQDYDAKNKENAVSLLESTFDKNFKLPTGFDESRFGEIQPKDTAMYNYIRKLYGTDDAGFKKAVALAKGDFVLKAEDASGQKFDDSSLKKQKKEKVYREFGFSNNDVFGPLEADDLPPFVNQGFQEQLRFNAGKRFKENKASKAMREQESDNAPLSVANQEADVDRFSPKVQAYIDYMRQASKENEDFNQGILVTQQSFQTLTEASNLFGTSLVDALLGHKDAFSSFQDGFGNLMKAFVAQIIAAEVRLLAFKAAIKVFGLAASYITGNPGVGTAIEAGGDVAVNATMAADGYDGVVNSPRMFVAGEAGPERVTVTPLGKSSSSGPDNSGVTIIVQGDVFNAEKLIDTMAMTNEKSRTRYV